MKDVCVDSIRLECEKKNKNHRRSLSKMITMDENESSDWSQNK